MQVDIINRQIQQSLPKEQHELISDGYHTFKELYEHRVTLFVALCNSLKETDRAINDNRDCMYTPDEKYVWKSKLHSD